MEFASHGDLLGLINEKKKKRAFFDEETIWRYAAEMLIGLKALHDRKIIHRDMKGANIFIADNNSLKLGDLNVSKVSK
jgi:NIMA (never in mitosis gene a)-related kinase